MYHKSHEYRVLLINALEDYQSQELMSDRELSIKAGLSPTLISKIKKGTTTPKLATLRKLRDIGVMIPKILPEFPPN